MAAVVVDGPVGDGLAACGVGMVGQRLPSPGCVDGRYGYIQSMCTDERHRRQGLARTVFVAPDAVVRRGGDHPGRPARQPDGRAPLPPARVHRPGRTRAPLARVAAPRQPSERAAASTTRPVAHRRSSLSSGPTSWTLAGNRPPVGTGQGQAGMAGVVDRQVGAARVGHGPVDRRGEHGEGGPGQHRRPLEGGGQLGPPRGPVGTARLVGRRRDAARQLHALDDVGAEAVRGRARRGGGRPASTRGTSPPNRRRWRRPSRGARPRRPRARWRRGRRRRRRRWPGRRRRCGPDRSPVPGSPPP